MDNNRPTFICGDALEVLKSLEEDSFDIILTDPPYKDEDVNGHDYYIFLDDWFHLAKKVAKDYVIFFNGANRLYDILQLLGEPFRILMWMKPRVKIAYRWEPIFIYSVAHGPWPSFNINGKIWSDILPYLPLHRGESVHRYEKPLPLMENIIRYIPTDKTVLDTFCGSGTTNLACMKFNISSTGIDINPDYIEIAKRKCKIGISNLKRFL
jgi:site-specific DNA-methyltransferase (adenine-specific)